MANVRDVAKYLVSLSQENTPLAITPLKLQKLVYYAQGYHLRDYGVTLFDENLEAWLHGPVVPILYRDFKDFGYFPIPNEPPYNDFHGLAEEEIRTIETVWADFGHLDGKFLEELTHQEDPWLDTDRNDIIEIDLIIEFFANPLVANN